MATACSNVKMSMLMFLLTMSFFDRCFGFCRYDCEIHHRYADRVKGVLTLDGLPEKGTPEYYKAMSHRDLKVHGRRRENTPLTLSNGNDTYLYSSLDRITGAFLEGAAPNGLFGIVMDNVSVPTVLAKKGLVANSFSMCFGSERVGRISFGDQGTNDQGETPFYVSRRYPTYSITGTSFTYLTNPSYSTFTTSYNSLVNEKRYYPDANYSIPFEYCYKPSANQKTYLVPYVNLTMKGGDIYFVSDPTIVVSLTDSGSNQAINIYCLAIVKSDDIDVIGQNFMTGNRLIYDREKNVLGWKASTCYDADSTKSADIPGTSSSARVKAFILTIMLMALFMPILPFV